MTSRPTFDQQPEFPPGADLPPSEATRREFMRWVGAGAVLAAASGCGRDPSERRYPYNETPRGLTPGLPQQYATANVIGGFATGLLVQSREGRPLKVEGNPQHPASLGATGAIEQALVLDVYDPLRLREITRGERPQSWEDLASALGKQLDRRGRGLCFLLPPTGSPLQMSLIDSIAATLPEARWCLWQPNQQQGQRSATRRIAGRPLQPHHDFAKAERVLSLDADFMGTMPFALRNAREFTSRRRITTASDGMNRLYMVEAKPSVTGSLADERLACKCSQVGRVAAAILAHMRGGIDTSQLGAANQRIERFARIAADDLLAHAGRSLVIAGDRQPWPVHVLAHALNEALGNLGQTVRWSEPVLYEPPGVSVSMPALIDAMRRGEVETLVIAGLDPVYALPPALEFTDALAGVRTSVCLTLFPSETAQRCTWQVPARHPLESWGDAVAYDGTVTFQQPLIEPFGDAHAIEELLLVFLARPWPGGYELLRGHWADSLAGAAAQGPGGDPQLAFERGLQLGLLPGTRAQLVAAPALPSTVLADALADVAAQPDIPGALELALYESPCVGDGSYFHNAWLQELPDPITKQTWGNAWILSPRTAATLGVEEGELLEVSVGAQAAVGPVVIVPTHADDVLATNLGYGQIFAHRPQFAPLDDVAPARLGFNAYTLRDELEQCWRPITQVTPLGQTVPLARTQDHFDMRDRPLALVRRIDELHERGQLAAHLRGPSAHLFMAPRPTASPQWGMVVDQTVCHGCSACVVACQAENNIPAVGPEAVDRGREMHWLRIDRYYVDVDGVNDPRVVHQPMMCQHCEYAPCEYVCPVNATVHSPDGLNEMVYNRCIGTRFCSNNCPYKVRRFNWFDYPRYDRSALQHNVEVSVRERGVMEKCTYCVQRIRNAQIAATLEHRPLADGEIQTACQQACPTAAIMFGDIADPDTTVSRWRARPQQYAVLHELGTEPRTRYLVKLINPTEAT